MSAIKDFLAGPSGLLDLSSGSALLLIVFLVIFGMATKDAIWAYKQNNHKDFSKFFSVSFVFGIFIFLIIY